jgi:hypothetical protein
LQTYPDSIFLARKCLQKEKVLYQVDSRAKHVQPSHLCKNPICDTSKRVKGQDDADAGSSGDWIN